MKVKNQYLKILSARIQMFTILANLNLNATNYYVNQVLYFPPKKMGKKNGLHMSKYVLGPSSGWTTRIVLTTGYFN